MARLQGNSSSTRTKKASAPLHQPYVTLLKKPDLERMRNGTPNELEVRQRQVQNELRSAAEKSARLAQRKAEEEIEACKVSSLTETDRLKAQEYANIRARAAEMRDENRDEVKRMNQMVQYSKCAAVRDKQIEEKKVRIAEERERQKALDAQMEAARVRDLAVQEEAEKLRFEQRRAGMAVIEEQLYEREQARLRAADILAQEQAKMTAAIVEAKERELRAVEEKKRAGAALLQEVVASNAEQAQRRKAAKAREAQEDLRILAFIKERDAKAQAALEEKAATAKARELETARLRSLQQRDMDRQAQIDELRARRWQEAAARKERKDAQAAAERAREQQRSLAAAREAQAASKIMQQAAMARMEAAEFQATLADIRTQQRLREQQEAEAAAVTKRHLQELHKQMEAGLAAMKAAAAQRLLEAPAIKEQLEREKAAIEAIRQKKLAQMEADGVPAKYRAELARKKFTDKGVQLKYATSNRSNLNRFL